MGYLGLAQAYLDQKDEAKWNATLDEYLAKIPDYGLEHAGVQVQIADHYMEKKHYAAALPYAEAAGETWAGWAMQCASRANEGLGNWERAELWQRRLSERYENSRSAWYQFCLRTGHGDVAAAARVAGPAAARIKAARATDPEQDGATLLLEGKRQQALEIFRRGVDLNRDVACGLHAAALLSDAGDRASSVALLKRTIEIAKEAGEQDKPIAALAVYLRDHAARTPDAALDAAAIEQVAKTAGNAAGAGAGAEASRVCYLGGKFLAARGQKEDAARLFKACTTAADAKDLNRALAEAELKTRAATTPSK
jgi:tetratricopeptide (TPR) repeat protein